MSMKYSKILLPAAFLCIATILGLRCGVAVTSTYTLGDVTVGATLAIPWLPSPPDIHVQRADGERVTLTWPTWAAVVSIFNVIICTAELIILSVLMCVKTRPRYFLIIISVLPVISLIESGLYIYLLGHYTDSLGDGDRGQTGSWSLYAAILLSLLCSSLELIKYFIESVYKSQEYIFSF